MHEHKARGLVSRRTVLWGALAGAAAVAGFGATLSHQDELGQVDPSVLRTLGTAGTGATTRPGGGTVRVERVFSAHRNREVDLVTMAPQADRSGLPVCLLLHGRFGTARNAAPGALPSALAAAVARGQVPPFAFVAVDGGGNNYWHAQPGDNPMGMLLDDLPGWLAERGLGGGDGLPFAVAGISMGGFGSLLYTRRRQERGRPVRAVAAISPALITNWPEMNKRKAFRDNAEWESMNPLRHIDKLGSARVGLWCGTEDSFIDGSRQFIRQARPLVGSTGPGRHDSTYFDRVSPDMVRFIGRHLPSA